MRFSYGLILTLIVAALPLFSHLDQLPLRLWDEGRLAVNSMEMTKPSNILIPTYKGGPDMWNSKPPLLIWLMALSQKMLGFNELAVRLPSALAGLFTCILLYWFCARKLGSAWLGIIAALILVTAEGFVRIHGTRTGDYDALLALLMFAYAAAFFLYCRKRKPVQLYLFFAGLTLAALTKGIAAFLFLPALVVYAFISGSAAAALRSRHFYAGMATFVVLVPGYYLLREQFNAGYLQAVMDNEIGGRYNTVIEGHAGEPDYYINLITARGLAQFYILVPLGFIAGLFHKDNMIRQATVYSALVAASHLIVISSAASKLEWYELPAYPFLALLAGIFLFTLFSLLKESRLWKQVLTRNIFPVLLLIILFWKPYNIILDRVTDPEPVPGNEADNQMAGYYLRDAYNKPGSLSGYTIGLNGEESNLVWYTNRLSAKGEQVKVALLHQMQGTEQLLVFGQAAAAYIEEHFQARQLKKEGNGYFYQLLGRR